MKTRRGEGSGFRAPGRRGPEPRQVPRFATALFPVPWLHVQGRDELLNSVRLYMCGRAIYLQPILQNIHTKDWRP